ncbi:SinI family autotransporter-associated protein [Enterobacteriaceae bacterium G50]|nr:SinI family autotransporter-associated protein [Enterobacteriaceae bacterium G50]
MKPYMKRGLTKVALALMVAGYCAIPSAMAGDAAWVASGTTAEFQGTIPWLYREGSNDPTGDADHVIVTSDGKGTRPAGSEGDKRLYVGDTITLGWDIGDTEGDVDEGAKGTDGATKETIKWFSYSDNAGSDKKEITSAAGKSNYTISDGDRGRYIGVEIQPITQTGNPYQGGALSLLDITTANGGGTDGGDDNVDPGPVVNQNLKVAIFVKDTKVNLIGGNTPIALDTTYVAKLFSDENGNGTWDAGTDVDVTANYDFAWVFNGNSKQLNTAGGIANARFDNNELSIPKTNADAKTNLNGGDRNGKTGLTIPDNGDGVQGYTLSIIYKHH